jgi:hypothetical protein
MASMSLFSGYVASDLYNTDVDALFEPVVGSPTTASPSSPSKNVIDYSKFKTKLCRNFLMGLPCPFESRCAFAHSMEEQAQGRAMAPAIPRPPSYHDFVATASVSEAALSDSQDSSRPSTPPAYPSRFRYDPYTPAGVIFAH